MYKCKLSIYNTYDTEYIYDSILPFIYLNNNIKVIGGVNRNSYRYITDPSETNMFYRS